MSMQLQIEVVKYEDLSEVDRDAVISLCSRAFEEDYGAAQESFKGSTHLLGYYEGKLVSHVLWVTRWLQVGNAPVLRTAYVEGVATEMQFRGRGFASMMMKRLIEEVEDFDLVALSPFSVAYYTRLGWELWLGPLYIRTEEGLVRTPRDGDVMIYRLSKTPDLDLYASLSAEWREGELW
jgi:aminoglycoside 2'-N-acetyltransferase I